MHVTPTPPPKPDQPTRGPYVRLRSAHYHPFIYANMVAEASPDVRPGDVVPVIDKRGQLFGHGIYNPKSRIALRMLRHGTEPADHDYLRSLVHRAVLLRTETLRLNESTNAYRLCHAEADGLSGLVVDRFDDCLSVELFSLGMHNLLNILLPEFTRLTDTRHSIVQADERAGQLEGFRLGPRRSDDCPNKITITENTVRFRVDLQAGHKTGFFCDQRENRRRFGLLCGGHEVLDLCCYTGGFALHAVRLGGASRVTGVDLDETAVATANKNANLNDVRVQFVHADAFAYSRQMQQNQRRYSRIVLDPSKLIPTRDDFDEGRRKYLDLNTLAMSLLEDDGLMLTCSCSGLLSRTEFIDIVRAAAERLNRSVQLLDVTGAGSDHPVALNCPQTEYLKALWLRLSER